MRETRSTLAGALLLLVWTTVATAGPSMPSKAPRTYRDRLAWQKVMQWPSDWERDYARCPMGQRGESGMTFWPLAPRRWLVEVIFCTAAYQTDQGYYMLEESGGRVKASLLDFPTWHFDEGKRATKGRDRRLLGVPHYDPKKRELTMLDKFRGLGDCGTFARYSIRRDRAVMLEFRANPDCEGPPKMPQEWKRYPTF